MKVYKASTGKEEKQSVWTNNIQFIQNLGKVRRMRWVFDSGPAVMTALNSYQVAVVTLRLEFGLINILELIC